MVYIGIDPGQSGGIAIIHNGRAGGANVEAMKMPATERDLCEALRPYQGYPAHAVLERVWSSPGWGHVGAFKFGLSYGAVRATLTCLDIPFDEVLPVKWQTVLGCRSGGDKNITKRRAQSLYPRLKVTHAIADALLIAEFCRRLRGQYGEAKEHDRAIAEGGAAARVAELAQLVESQRQRTIRRRVEKARATIADAAGDVAGTSRAAR